MKKDQPLTYSKAGVDVRKGDNFSSSIKLMAQDTISGNVVSGIGGFASLFSVDRRKYYDPVIVSSTDGVGTKLLIAQACNKHDSIGIDLVAMCVNDVIAQGGEPAFFLDYIAVGKLREELCCDIIRGIVDGCKIAGCALIGGETAEMPGVYDGEKYDIAGFAVGIAERSEILPRSDICIGDVIVGLHSNGLHSNGYSLVRAALERSQISYNDALPWDCSKTWADELLKPTIIYNEVLSLRQYIKGIAHITGGGITNINRILPQGVTYRLDNRGFPEVFDYIMRYGNIERNEMLHTFNCGIGMTLIIAPDYVDDAIKELGCYNASIIGEVIHSL